MNLKRNKMSKFEKIQDFVYKYIFPVYIFVAGFAAGALYGLIKTLLIIG
jgi:uncharacterized membrane protein